MKSPVARAKLSPPFGFLSDCEVSAEDIDRVFAAAGIAAPSSEHRAALARTMIGYHEDSAIWAMAASPAEVRDRLLEVARLAKSLRKLLARLAGGGVQYRDGNYHLRGGAAALPGGDISPADAIAWERLAGMAERLLDGQRLSEVGKSAAFVEALAKEAAAEIVGKDGPKGNPHRLGFIWELHQIFLAAGGRGSIAKRSGRYSGRFLEMAKAALATIEGNELTISALGHAIEAALSPKPSENKT